MINTPPLNPGPGDPSDLIRAYGNYYRPCLTCGSTVYHIAGIEQPHDCQPPRTIPEKIAHAYWSGHDQAGTTGDWPDGSETKAADDEMYQS